jgi:hypothetical protein
MATRKTRKTKETETREAEPARRNTVRKNWDIDREIAAKVAMKCALEPEYISESKWVSRELGKLLSGCYWVDGVKPRKGAATAEGKEGEPAADGTAAGDEEAGGVV